MSRNAEDCENSGSLPQLESEPEVEQIGEAPEEVPFEIPKKWKWMNFDCVVKTFPSKNYQIQTKEIALEGKYPVISQAKAKIDGYCNDESKLIPRDKIPFVIFGDHTRVVKFVNRQCVIGADGTKLLRSDVYDISFLFYVIFFLAPNLREAGYSRHFKFLRARALPVPPLAEQRRIVARLNELLPLVDDFGEAQEAFTIAQTEFPGKLKASLLQAAIEGKLVPQLESEPEVEQIGNAPEEVPFEIPKKWKWVQLKTIFAKRSTINPVDYGESKVELWSIPAFDKGKPEVVPARLIGSSKKVVVEGDVLLSKIVPHIKRAWVVSETNGYEKLASTEWIVFHSNDFFPNFLTMALTEPHFHSSLMSTISGMGSLKRANPQKVGELYIPCPSLAEQHRIVARLNKLLASINQLGD